MLRAKIDEQYQRASITSPNVFTIPAYLAAYNNSEVIMWKTAMLTYVVKNYQYVKEKLTVIPGLKIMKLEASYLVWINYAETNLT
ncbi:Cystathionine beta-lyase PatB [Spiroplasma poulsonii]|nr:hypothetical protein [Spiroplasma poulsonii]PWF95526.1 Cystathionine beta-lyase PatB [Spiroplasma poulsonii]